MRVVPLHVYLVALSVFATPLPLVAQTPVADFGAVPSAETLSRLDKNLGQVSRVRVVLHRGVLVLGDVHVDEQGVHYSSILERNVADTLSAPGLVPWARVTQIDKRVSAAGRGARAGGIFLGALGALSGMAIGGVVEGSDTGAIGGGLLGAAIGGGVGGAIGGLIASAGHRWQRLYPSNADLNPR